MEDIIESIKSLSSYRDISYYTFHLRFALWRNLSGSKWKGIPCYLKSICNETKCLINESPLKQEDIIQYIANDNNNQSYFYISQCILLYGASIKLTDYQRYCIASEQAHLPSDISIDDDILACAVVCFVLDKNRYNDWDFNNIVSEEQFVYPTTDYKLSKVKDIDFRQNGYIYDGKYYLYSVYIDVKTLFAGDKMPAIFRVMTENIDMNNADFYLRLDERLSIPVGEAQIIDCEIAEKFRGVSFRFANTKLEKMKNIIVHGNPETFDKLLFVIKKDYDDSLNEKFWHVEIEQLPYIDRDKQRKFVCTTFLHAKYYPNRKSFRHIDFTKNQYPFEQYCVKQSDCSNQDIKIDFYTTKKCHYKIWCVENIDINENIWYKLVITSLMDKYRTLFKEVLEMSS